MTPGTGTPDEILLEPAPREWAGMLRASWEAHRHDDERLALRESLGLPTDRPVVMTGHQPVVFHAGVLAKYMAARALASRTGAHAAFLVVDQDETDPGALRVPTLNANDEIGESTLRLLPSPGPGVPAGFVGPGAPRQPDAAALARSPWGFVREGVASIVGALRAHADASSLAAQSALASFDLMRPFTGDASHVLASSLSSTALFERVLARLREDPARFVRLHNDAAAAHPNAGVAMLATDDARGVHEAPLWRVGAGEARRRVLSDQLVGVAPASLAPRALLMTLLVRAGACDLFIHGAGGWEYDRITERLAREWLGVELAPMTLATATLRLPLLSDAPPTEREVADAAWAAHRAAHDPALLDDPAGAAAKRGLLARMAAAPRRSAERAALYREMHALLDRTRVAHSEEITRFRDAAETLRRRHDAAGLANDRTWAFALHPRDALGSLASAIDSLFS